MSLYAPDIDVRLRPATAEDAAMLTRWDREPHVIACSSDDPALEVAFDGMDWPDELTNSAYELDYRIAEANGEPVGVLAICDPHTEPSHYWGEIEPNLRAIDIWIGPAEWLGRGVGTSMMIQILDECFAVPEVTAIVIDPLNTNVAAHRFYQRLGFVVEGWRMFDEDDCLVHRLTRSDWEKRSLVIPAEAKRRAGTPGSLTDAGPAGEPGRDLNTVAVGEHSPGSTLTGRPGGEKMEDARPGSSLRFGRDDNPCPTGKGHR